MISRYCRPEMARLWSTEYRLQKWIEIEVLACEAWAELGVIPRDAARRIRQRSDFQVDEGFVRRVSEIEEETRHDVVAFTAALAERLGEDGKYVHYGMTSYDVVDTALSVLMVEAADLILEALERLRDVTGSRAREFKKTVMIGRTHGVHAEPVTFGLKLAVWFDEIKRNIHRVKRAREVVRVGKLSGAVGTFANVDPFVEKYVCSKLGLECAPVSTQIVQRDRHAEYLCHLAVVASSLEKFATEIRGLQRTEIREVEEPFREGQKGSSAMPHKRNPISCERITGLARIVRANAMVGLENVPLWHERDLSNSAPERMVIPESSTLVHYMLWLFTSIVGEMKVYPDRMKENLELTRGLVFSQRVLLALVEAGLRRDEAYGIVQKLAMRAWDEGVSFRTLVENDEQVLSTLGPERLSRCFEVGDQLAHVEELFARVGLE